MILFMNNSSRYLIILVSVFLGMSVTVACGQDTLTVMSYNIYHGENPYQSGQSNLQQVAALINKVDPDLVALQEVDSLTGRSAPLNDGDPLNQVQYLADQTDMHGYFGKAMDYDGGGYGEGLLSSRKLKSMKIILPTPEGGEPRALLLVKYPLNDTDTLVFGGTHLGHQYPANRIAQMQKINDYVGSIGQPVIIAGDFNFTPSSKPYKIASQRWIDAARRSNNAEPTYSYDQPEKRIDYIFLSKKAGWDVIDMNVLKVGHSDHMPVVLTVIVE